MVLLGCGGGSSSPRDGGTAGGGGGLTGTAGTAGTGSGTAGTGGGVGGSGTAGAPMPTGSLVFTGGFPALIGRGAPCTWEEGATGDRWCAFIADSVSIPGNADLFVLNVTKAAAGTSVSCGLTDANCIKLTSSWAEDQFHPSGFGGDTLVYYELTGTPFSWRPGTTAGRALATVDATTSDIWACSASSKGTAAYCLSDLPVAMQTDPNNILLSNLLAGKVDGTASPPLARVEQVISGNVMDVNFAHFQVGFPVPGSDTIAWSSRATISGPEILKMQTIGNDASRVTVASAINSWSGSPDGTRWYWFSAVNETSGAGTLQSAPYPAGTSPVNIAPNVLQYDFPTPTSLMLVDSAEAMLGFANPVSAPTTSVSLDTGVIAFVALSKQGHAAYVKTTSTSANMTVFSDMFVKKVDGTGACTVTSATNSLPLDTLFSPNASALTWIQRGTTAVLAQFTRLSDCMSMNVGSNVVWTEPLGDRAVLYMDGFNNLNGTASMKVRNVAAGAISADPATTVSGLVGTFMTVSTGGADVVVYTVDGGGNDDGVYVRAFGP